MSHPISPPHSGDAAIVAEFPLSASQTRCWIIDRADPGTATLNVAVRWELIGPLRDEDLERAFRTVIARHEILRTAYAEIDGVPVQRVHATVPFQLGTVDLRAMSEDQQPERVEAIARETAAQPFDLSRPGLIRATLIRLSGERAILCFVVHQSCFDGFSIRVLSREIGAALSGNGLPELPLQYGDYALWQEAYFESGPLDDDLQYWCDTLVDAPYFEVPPDRPRTARKDIRSGQVSIDLPEGFGDRLDRAARGAELSRFAFGCAVFSAALARVTGSQNVLFGTQIAGRLDEELEPLIGVFINNLVLRFRATPDASLSEHIAAARPVVEGALIHQQLPFNKLVEALNPPRDPARTPLISINFNLQSVFMETQTHGDLTLRSAPSHAPGALYDLDLAVMERPTGWQITLEYAQALFDPASAQAIADTVVSTFDTAFNAPETPLSMLPLTGSVREVAATNTAEMPKGLADLEGALAAHPMVSEAIALPDGEGAYGFVVPADTGTFPLEQIPDAVHNDLGPTPLPLTGLSVLAGLPRNSMGAPNRDALRVPRARNGAVTGTPVLQETLTALKADWSDLLGLPQVASASHFFDLGGHSLLVLRLIGRLRDRWDVQIDLTELYETPVLQDFARLVADRRAARAPDGADRTLLRLRKDGEGQPLIAINNAATALALSTLDGETRPISCVLIPHDAPDIDAKTPFADIARLYADQARRLQPRGPYLLYGNCVHGNLALEAARLLHADGAEIAGVIMKDVWEPGYVQQIHGDRRLRTQDRRHSLALRLRYWREGEMSLAALLGSYGVFHRTGLLSMLRAFRLVGHDRKTDLEEGQERFVVATSAARDRYRPDPITFPVLHIVTDATPQGPHWKASIGWEDVVTADALTTVHVDTVYVSQAKRIGVDQLATEITAFLARQANH